jgi:hypothetical protein
MNEPVAGWAVADPDATCFDPGRLQPLGIGRREQWRSQDRGGQETAPAEQALFHRRVCSHSFNHDHGILTPKSENRCAKANG